MNILGHNPVVWGVVRVGLQGEFFEDGKVLDREAPIEELRMLLYNAQACDILLNGLYPKEFKKTSCLENATRIWDTLVDKFKMKDSEGIAEMYSRLALITNEIASLGSEE